MVFVRYGKHREVTDYRAVGGRVSHKSREPLPGTTIFASSHLAYRFLSVTLMDGSITHPVIMQLREN